MNLLVSALSASFYLSRFASNEPTKRSTDVFVTSLSSFWVDLLSPLSYFVSISVRLYLLDFLDVQLESSFSVWPNSSLLLLDQVLFWMVSGILTNICLFSITIPPFLLNAWLSIFISSSLLHSRIYPYSRSMPNWTQAVLTVGGSWLSGLWLSVGWGGLFCVFSSTCLWFIIFFDVLFMPKGSNSIPSISCGSLIAI